MTKTREWIMPLLLVLLLAGLGYYLGFYAPLQEELSAIASQSAQIDSEIAAAMDKAGSMDAMQAELDELLSKSVDEITEIAPYDNKEAVLNQLHRILEQAEDYALRFTEPDVEEGGTVRRSISMDFSCSSYAAARSIIRDLSESHWRCLITNLSISAGDGNMMEDAVSVSATVVFFEHTDLA